MKPFSQQNPISLRIDLLRTMWTEKVSFTDKSLVRWIVQPDELRMIDAFCLMEGSEHGQLNDLFMRMPTHFINPETYDNDLIQEWLVTWENPEAQEQLSSSGVVCNWNSEPWKAKLNSSLKLSFFECMSEFASSIEGFKDKLVLYLIPLQCNDEAEWVKWINNSLEEGIPDNLIVMFSDVMNYELFNHLKKNKKVVHIVPDLKMDSAVQEIASDGDPNDPSVQFNTCMLKISEALGRKNKAGVEKWGEKAIEAGRKSGSPNLEVAACLAYGAAYLQLKKYPESIKLFQQGKEKAKEGIIAGEEECKPVMLQTYAFEGSVYVRQKKYNIARPLYEEMAELAREQQNFIMETDALRMASFTAEKSGKQEDAYALLKKSYTSALQLDDETIKYSPMLVVGDSLYKEAEKHNDNTLAKEVDKELQKHWGEKWKELALQSEKNKATYGKRQWF